MGLNWWQVSAIGFGSLVVLRLGASPYLIHRQQVIELENARTHNEGLDSTITQQQLDLMQLRREIRERSLAEAVKIPDTLREIWRVAEDVRTERSKAEPDHDELAKVVMESLRIEDSDIKLKNRQLNTPSAIREETKRLSKKLALDKKPKGERRKFVRRFSGSLDSSGYGLQLETDSQYHSVLERLSMERTSIAGTLIDHWVDIFLEDLTDLYNFELLMVYDKVEGKLYMFPPEMRESIRSARQDIEKHMRGIYGQVSRTLEKWEEGREV